MRIAITSHRPHKLWGYDLTHPKYRELTKILENLFKKFQADHVIVGMVLGVDQLAAGVVVLMVFNKVRGRSFMEKWQKYRVVLEERESRLHELEVFIPLNKNLDEVLMTAEESETLIGFIKTLQALGCVIGKVKQDSEYLFESEVFDTEFLDIVDNKKLGVIKRGSLEKSLYFK